MAPPFVKALTVLLSVSASNAYWLMGINNFITTERLDPIVNPDGVSGHVHSVLGGSNFGASNVTTARLRQSECTSIPIPEDKSNYWFPHLYFQWANGSFTSLTGGAVIYYLFDDKPGTTTAFPDDFRMISGNPTTRAYDPNSHEQSAISFLCLDFNGVTTEHKGLPNKPCPSGVRAQVNFQSCWDGKNIDSPDHKSHVAYRSEGADKGSCKDPRFPVTLPRIFIEVYWGSNEFDKYRFQAMNTTQPFVYSYGDRTGYGYHADFINGWDKGVLQNAVDKCNCNIYGDPTCCVDKGIFHIEKEKKCFITKSVDEVVTGTIPRLPGNNPVQEEGPRAVMYSDTVIPGIIKPVYVYTSGKPTATGKVVIPPSTIAGGFTSSSTTLTSTTTKPTPTTISVSSTTVKVPTTTPVTTSSTSLSTKLSSTVYVTSSKTFIVTVPTSSTSVTTKLPDQKPTTVKGIATIVPNVTISSTVKPITTTRFSTVISSTVKPISITPSSTVIPSTIKPITTSSIAISTAKSTTVKSSSTLLFNSTVHSTTATIKSTSTSLSPAVVTPTTVNGPVYQTATITDASGHPFHTCVDTPKNLKSHLQKFRNKGHGLHRLHHE